MTVVPMVEHRKEGGLAAPTRHPLDWRSSDFYDEEMLHSEMRRVFDICHGCRRCFNLCNAFPTLFDLIDASSTMEVDGVAEEDYSQVVEHCYLCDMCFMSKCPYVPPHEWNVDFPHLMLRAKAVHFQQHGAKMRDRVLSATDTLGKLATIPVVVNAVNRVNRTPALRAAMEATLGVHRSAWVPEYTQQPFRKKYQATRKTTPLASVAKPVGKTALFTTCYGNYCETALCTDLITVFEHNRIRVTIPATEQCCGMPKWELGDLHAVEAAMHANLPILAELVDQGFDIVAPIPSCVLMFKHELPLMFPDNEGVAKVSQAIFDPFEYLWKHHQRGALRLDFHRPLGRVAYHAACHQRVQNIGPRTRDVLQLIPGAEVMMIERCSGHDGTYAVKREYYPAAMKIVRPVVKQISDKAPDYYTSDCAMAGHHIEHAVASGKPVSAPLTLLRYAYGI